MAKKDNTLWSLPCNLAIIGLAVYSFHAFGWRGLGIWFATCIFTSGSLSFGE